MSDVLLQQIDELLTRRIGVFAEDMQHKLDLVVEGQQMLAERMDRMGGELRADIAMVDHRVTVVHVELGQQIDGVEQKLTKRIDGVEKKLTKRIDGVEQKLTKRIDGVEQKLTIRIDEVEQKLTKRIDGVEQKLDAVAVDLSAHRRDTEAHSIYRVGE